jgi:hypothetical protein
MVVQVVVAQAQGEVEQVQPELSIQAVVVVLGVVAVVAAQVAQAGPELS